MKHFSRTVNPMVAIVFAVVLLVLSLATGCTTGTTTPTAPATGDASTPAAVQGGGVPVRQVRITVEDDGFRPAEIHARAGESLLLVIRRKTDKTCATAVQIPSLGVARTELPLEQDVTVPLRVSKAGRYVFSCPMDMVKGMLIVDP